MTPRVIRNLLWLGLLFMAPVPLMLGVASGLMPVVRVLMFAGVCLAVMIVEGTQGAVDLLAMMLIVQALVFGALWFGVAALVARGLALLPRGVAIVSVVLVLVTGIVLTSSFSWYQTPFRGAGTRANLWEIFE